MPVGNRRAVIAMCSLVGGAGLIILRAAAASGQCMVAPEGASATFTAAPNAIFESDFAAGSGRVPIGVKFAFGAPVMGTHDGRPSIVATSPSGIVVPLASGLPDQYTVEVDFVHRATRQVGAATIAVYGGGRVTPGTSVGTRVDVGTQHWYVSGGGANQQGDLGSDVAELCIGQPSTLRLQGDGNDLAVFLDARLVTQVSDAKFRQPGGIAIEMEGRDGEGNAVYVTGIRIRGAVAGAVATTTQASTSAPTTDPTALPITVKPTTTTDPTALPITVKPATTTDPTALPITVKPTTDTVARVVTSPVSPTTTTVSRTRTTSLDTTTSPAAIPTATSAPMAPVAGTAEAIALPATGFAAVAGPKYNLLTWNAPAGAAGYVLRRYDFVSQQRVTMKAGGDTLLQANGFLDSAVTPGVTYGYRLLTYYRSSSGVLHTHPDTGAGVQSTPKDPTAAPSLPSDFRKPVPLYVTVTESHSVNPIDMSDTTYKYTLDIRYNWHAGAAGYDLARDNGAAYHPNRFWVMVAAHPGIHMTAPISIMGSRTHYCVRAVSPAHPVTGTRIGTHPTLIVLSSANKLYSGSWRGDKGRYSYTVQTYAYPQQFEGENIAGLCPWSSEPTTW